MGALPRDSLRSRVTRMGVLGGFCLVLVGTSSSLNAAVLGARSVNQWRRLTVQLGEVPTVYLRKDDLRVWFTTPTGWVQFSAHLSHPRIPTDGYEVSTALLRLSEKPTRLAALEHGWREAAVIAGPEWQ